MCLENCSRDFRYDVRRIVLEIRVVLEVLSKSVDQSCFTSGLSPYDVDIRSGLSGGHKSLSESPRGSCIEPAIIHEMVTYWNHG